MSNLLVEPRSRSYAFQLEVGGKYATEVVCAVLGHAAASAIKVSDTDQSDRVSICACSLSSTAA